VGHPPSVTLVVDRPQRVDHPTGGAMNLDLARWQFAITTVYHFLFVR
jgi:hypothetical protein